MEVLESQGKRMKESDQVTVGHPIVVRALIDRKREYELQTGLNDGATRGYAVC